MGVVRLFFLSIPMQNVQFVEILPELHEKNKICAIVYLLCYILSNRPIVQFSWICPLHYFQ